MRRWWVLGLAVVVAGCGATSNIFRERDEVGASPQEQLYLARSYLEKGETAKALEIADRVKRMLANQKDSPLYKEACLIAGQARIGEQNLGASNLASIASELEETIGQEQGRIDEEKIIEAVEETGLFKIEKDEQGNIVSVQTLEEEKREALEEGREDLRDSLGIQVQDTNNDGIPDEVLITEEKLDPDAGATLISADIVLTIDNALGIFDQDNDGDVTKEEVDEVIKTSQDLEEHKQELGEMLVTVEEAILVTDKVKDDVGLEEEFVQEFEDNKNDVLQAINDAQKALAQNKVEDFKNALEQLLNLRAQE